MSSRDYCGANCRGVKRRRWCGGHASDYGHCGSSDCSTCYGPGVDHGDCEPDDPEPEPEAEIAAAAVAM